MSGIKESLDVLEALKELAKDVKEAAADQVFDWKDLRLLIDNFSVLKTAFEDIDQVKEELSELDAQEVKELVSGLVDIVAVLFLKK